MYLIDSDVLIDAKNRHYAFDVVPAFWDWVAQQHLAGKVFVVQRVAEEILAGADELADWLKAQPASFKLVPTSADATSLATVSQWALGAGYQQAAVAAFLQAGDYFIVAQGLTLGYTVVTQERPEPASKKKIKIPDACDAVGVKWTTPFQMLKAEGARFTL
ncbi:MAG TPA: DUF4411 family protein [Mycobacteriales bacterium]|jgi:hypothetical protein|nr:DUF4411 family protein [Mycobacteriales bacterium]